ncbi:hypothetical protein [Telluribacter sp. SYSU D00476]|uniref:hypothetical protein n=1 Tax=Telluribacter sp. SYSU D00476 TaxID=2811430 RepID=UPI001FF6ED39|nr:hypothetical protein [Telluribacter sp. SYSU D00476]
MKKFFLTFVVMAMFTLASQSAFAQYEKGDKLLNVGIGLGTYGYGGIGLGGSFEVGVHDAISVGALGGYSSRGYLGYRWSVLTIGARGSYHFNELLNLNDERFDLYAGLGLAYRNINYGGIYDSYGDGVSLLAHIGGRYYFKPSTALFAELGSGFSVLHAGVAFKF